MKKEIISPEWQYNEMQQVGTDYNDEAQVEAYDLRMKLLRDVREEAGGIIKLIDIKKNDTVLEIGTGTGSFAIEAARQCSKVIAIDVSRRMLEFAEQKAISEGAANVEFHHAGFLTYNHSGGPVDAIVSQLALHHLPDFWKAVALGRIFGMLRTGGRFYLMDTVYSFDLHDHNCFFNNLISRIKKAADEELTRDLVIGIREEYTTLDWIMEGLIRKTGFFIEKADYHEGFIAVYKCIKS